MTLESEPIMMPHRSAATATAPVAVPVPRILVVDDTPDNLFLMNGLLEDRFQVVLAPSGKEALTIIMSDNPPDMVLLDIMMPDMDGYEVLRRIRQHPPTANIPVIFLTALASTQDELLGLDLGAIDYLTKPVNPDQLLARVEAHVRATAQARRVEALAEKLARHLPPREWQALFSAGARETIRFEQKTLTVLYVDASESAHWMTHGHDSFGEDVERLAEAHGGTVDAFVDEATVVFFEDAGECVKMAVDLQRCTADMRLRMGIHTGISDISTFGSDLHTDCTLIGPESGLAAKVAAAASIGGIAVSPQTQALLGREVHVDRQGHLIALDWADSMPPAQTVQAAQAAQAVQRPARSAHRRHATH